MAGNLTVVLQVILHVGTEFLKSFIDMSLDMLFKIHQSCFFRAQQMNRYRLRERTAIQYDVITRLRRRCRRR